MSKSKSAALAITVTAAPVFPVASIVLNFRLSPVLSMYEITYFQSSQYLSLICSLLAAFIDISSEMAV